MSIAAKNHGDDAPSGENLEYEPVYSALNMAVAFEGEQQMGDAVKEAKEPDPKVILGHAREILDKSNDLNAAIYYGYAQLRLEGLPGLPEATGFLRSCLEEFWDSCHPQLDADDDNDPTMRVNCLLGLVNRQTILSALRRAPLTKSPSFGMISMRDLAIAEGEVPPPAGMENPPTAQTVSAAFQDTPADILDANHAAAQAALDDITAINGVFDDKLPGQGPNLNDVVTSLKKIVAALSPHISQDAVAAEETVAEQGGDGAAPGPAAPVAAPGTITSPADVDKALGKIIDYYTEHEPSSPLPILLMRARRLVGADFMTIIQDLAPLGLENVQLIGGKENPE